MTRRRSFSWATASRTSITARRWSGAMVRASVSNSCCDWAMSVQVIAINGGGATAVRESLAQKPRALRHKRSSSGLVPPAISTTNRSHGSVFRFRSVIESLPTRGDSRSRHDLQRLSRDPIKHALARFVHLCYHALPAGLKSSSSTKRSECACFDYYCRFCSAPYPPATTAGSRRMPSFSVPTRCSRAPGSFSRSTTKGRSSGRGWSKRDSPATASSPSPIVG